MISKSAFGTFRIPFNSILDDQPEDTEPSGRVDVEEVEDVLGNIIDVNAMYDNDD